MARTKFEPDKPHKPEREQPSEGERKRPNWLGTVVFFLILMVTVAMLYFGWQPRAQKPLTIPYSDFTSQIRADNVTKVTLTGQRAEGNFALKMRLINGVLLRDDPSAEGGTTGTTFKTTVPDGAQEDLIRLLEERRVRLTVNEDGGALLPTLLITLLPIVLLGGFLYFIMRGSLRAAGGGRDALRFGESKARIYDVKRPDVTFADIAGEDEAKAELTQVVDFLRNAKKYHALGARLPRGILLLGPPGTGKTLLAKAVAGEANVPFYTVSGSEFVELFVGVGASRVRDLFERAKQSAPAIVFVDELDAVGRQRFAGIGGGNDEREQTLNQLLVEMDGFEPHDEVIVLAATNRPDVLDPALLRPGRFDRQVALGLPDRRGRVAILRIHTRGIPIAADVDLEAYAAATPGFSGADLANLVNEATLLAGAHDKQAVDRADFDEALDKIVLGSARAVIIGEREKRLLAYHEAGHALVARLTKGADPLRKISIVPRGQALGVTVQSPSEDHFTYTREYLLGRLAILMGGRTAEQLIFGDVTTGAQNDLKEATTLARRMVGLWGMSAEVGPYFLGLGEQHVFLGREITREGGDISEEMLARAEVATRGLLDDAGEHATALLIANRDRLDTLAQALIEAETLDEREIAAIIDPTAAPAGAVAAFALAPLDAVAASPPSERFSHRQF
jgi:cell division protease FtsH